MRPTSDFDYELPPGSIAQEPLAERDQSRMLVLDRRTGGLTHARVADLPAYLTSGDLLVLNDTRVIPARVFGHWADTRGRVEILFLEPEPELPGQWRVLCKSRRRPMPALQLDFSGGEVATVRAVEGEGRLTIAFANDRAPWDVMEREGVPPLPPYIHRDREGGDARARQDRERYQTLYAAHPGSVAAPTAGLHFTPRLLEALEARGVGRAALTLHVGLGTFRPVKTEDADAHRMEAERYRLPPETCERLAATRALGRRVIAVGSTVVRTLEHAARTGLQAGDGRTDLYIRPPYPFQVVDAMLTNFHLPRSTLLMMVSALAGHDPSGDRAVGAGDPDRGRTMVLEAYRVAVREGYRFYSYGDCMLLL